MLSKEEVEHIAVLARIGLSDDEVARYQKDLSQVLDFFKELEAFDMPPEETSESVPRKKNDTREDRVENFPSHGRKIIMDNMPERKEGYVKVRSVF